MAGVVDRNPQLHPVTGIQAQSVGQQVGGLGNPVGE